MKNIIIAMILIAFTQTLCTDGCLSCSDNNECLVCDITNGYFLKGTQCLKSSIKNCQIFDLAGHCFVCQQGYYTDPHAEQCLSAVDTGELDTNCQRFNLERQCVQCRENHYLIGSTCIEVPENEKITDCLMYNTKSECVECKSDTTLNLLGTACLKNSEIDNCTEQTAVKCNHCKDGYTKNANYFLLAIQTELATKNYSQSYPKIANYVDTTHYFEEGCLKNIGENCVMYQDFNQCLLCLPEHYLKGGKCYSFPKEQIENCKVYQTEDKCLECQQGYYLTGTNNCKKIESNSFLTNCVLYNPRAQTIECIQCKNNYFVNTSKGCSKRTRDINLCKDFSDTSDTCETCQDGFRVTDDGIKCLSEIGNCLTYASSLGSATLSQFTCQRCNRGLYFYTGTNTCQTGNVDHCQFYLTNPDQCQVCDNKYYLQGGNCLEHNHITNCGVYSQTNPNECDECDNTSIKMTQTTGCDAVEIKGCKVYESTQTCLECEDGYDLTNKLCTLLDVDLHCKRSEDGVCKLCIDQYFLNSDNLCYLPFQYERSNCISNKNDGTTGDFFTTGCKVCQDYHIPFDLKNHNVCLTVDEFALIQSTYEVANCQRYKIVNKQIKCKQCEVTYILDEANNTCSKDCAAGEFKLNFHFEDDGLYGHQYKNNYYCVTHENTKTKSVTLNQNYGVTSWKLNTGWSYKMDFTKVTNSKLVLPENVDGVALSQDLYTYPDYTEADTFQPTTDTQNATDNFFIDAKGETVDQCEFYFEYRTVNYCSKCQFGYFGQIDFYKIDNCHRYDDTNEQCLECVYQYKLSSDFHSCTFTEIEGCTLYELNTTLCLACDEGMYLDVANNLCKQTNINDPTETTPFTAIDNCKVHHPYEALKCLICDKDYLLNSLQTKCGKLIENCRKTVYKADNMTLECERCEMGYYSTDATAKADCVKGANDPLYCWEYENGTGNCIAYRNVLQTHKTNECVKPFPLDNCVEYNTANPPVCTKCDEEDYYMVGGTGQDAGVCCKYYTYPGATQDPTAECTQTNAQNPNCKKYEKLGDGTYTCTECQHGYLMNPIAKDPSDASDTTPTKICCPFGSQQGASLTKLCQNFVIAQPPNSTAGTLTCDVFDLDTEKCKLCQTGEYLHKGKCCQLTKHHTGADTAIDCSDDNITHTNCNKVDDSNNCIECIANFTRKDNLCCNLSTHFFEATSATAWQCTTTAGKIADCDEVTSTWDPAAAGGTGAVLNTCVTCAANHYKVNDNKNCCLEATDNTSEIWDGTQCKAINTITGHSGIGDCKIYDNTSTSTTIKDSYLCDTCNTATNFPSTQGRICCGAGELYDFDESKTGEIDCRTDDFIYENCDHVIPFDATNQFCQSCKDNHYKINNRCTPYGSYMLLLRENSTPTWEDTEINDSLVTTASSQTANKLCNKVRYVEGTDSSDTNVKLKCDQCKDGYALRAAYVATGDTETAELPCEDIKLQQGYFVDSITSTTLPIDTYARNCLLFNAANDVCQHTAINSVFQFGYCATYGTYITQKVTQNQPCCPEGKYWNAGNGACEANTISDCLIQSIDGQTCYQCKDGYFFADATPDTCTAYTTVDNCLEYSSATDCSRCEFGYYLEVGTLTSCEADPSNDRFLKYCVLGAAGASCTTCHPGYYKSLDYCCKYGTFQKANGQECVPIEVPNCAKFTETGGECNDCFTFENQYCYTSEDWIYKLSTAANSPYIIEESITTYDHDNDDYNNFKEYYIYNKNCCKVGYYWNTTKCESIPLANCLKLGTSATDCTECKPDYKFDTDECVQLTAVESGYYQSNSKYCPEYHYYDSTSDRCLKHPDLNCKEASNNYSCDTCKDNFTLSDFWSKLIITHKAGERDGCMEQLPNIVFKTCVESDAANYPTASGDASITDFDMFIHKKMYFRRQNCNVYDVATETCTANQCFDGYYLVENRCCKTDEYPFNDGCIKKKTILDLCNYYDESTYTCKGCNFGYTLTNDYCCKYGSVYDKLNDVCIEQPMNCKTFNVEQNLCTECNEDNYMDSHNHCCPNYQYYDEDTKQCMNFNSYGTVGCMQGEKDYCYVCSTSSFKLDFDTTQSSSFVKSNGKCCQSGYTYDTTLGLCTTVSSLCKTYNDYGVCTLCNDNFYLSGGECCPLGTANDGTGSCVTDDSTIHCTEWTHDAGGDHTCSKCKDGFYLVSDHCCPFYYSWDTTDSECQKIKILTLSGGDFDDNGYLSLARNCKILESTTRTYSTKPFYSCKECYDGYYISTQVSNNFSDHFSYQNLRKCCPELKVAHQFEYDGCILLDKSNMSEYPDSGQLYFPSTESDCLQGDYLYTAVISGQTDYRNQFVCKKCKDGKVAEILNRNYFDDVTAYVTDSNDDPSANQYVTCVPRAAKHKDNCLAHYVKTDGTVTRYCRNFDHTKYYLSWVISGNNTADTDSQQKPCSFGEYYQQSDDSCIAMASLGAQFTGCRKASTTTGNAPYTCSECDNGYYFVATPHTGEPYCIEEKDDGTYAGNCLILETESDGSGGTKDTCRVCYPGYGIDSAPACVEITTNKPEYCSSSSDSTVTCNYCTKMTVNSVEYQTYLSNDRCCLEGQVYHPTINHCVAVDDCLAAADDTKEITECQFCNWKKDLFVVGNGTADGKCCIKGTVPTANNMCEQPQDAHLIQCKFFSSKTACREATDLEKQYLTETEYYPCFSTGHYYHDAACCPQNEYNDSGTCTAPTTAPANNCKEFKQGSTTECEVCKDDKYMAGTNICCALTEYDKAGTCTTISTSEITGVDSDCNKYKDNQCISCGTGDLNGEGCCGTNIKDSSGACVAKTAVTNCAIQLRNDCLKCDNGYYLTGGICCQYGYYKNAGGTCDNTTVVTGCQIPDGSAPTKCLTCQSGKRFSINKCCDIGKLQIVTAGECLDETLVLNCLKFNASNECTKCISDTDLYITNNMCCPLGQKYNSTSKACEDIDKYCQKVDDGGDVCNTCINGYYVNPNDTTKCCREQIKPGDACRQITLSPDVKNCSKFDTSLDCIECQSGYNLYGQVCCKSGTVLLQNGTTQDHCVQMNILLDNCDQFDPLTLKCKTCSSNYYNSTNDQKVCCKDGTHFSMDSVECINNYPGCDEQQYDQCTKCATDFYLTGNTQKRCCQDTQYFNDDDDECVDIPIENCVQMIHQGGNFECSKCSDPTGADYDTHLTNGHCCFSNEFWDPKALRCSNPIKYCTSYENDSTTPKCLTCEGTKQVLDGQSKCCERQRFYFSTRDDECYAQAPLAKFSWTCSVYDPFLFKCVNCKHGYYKMNDHCCLEGTWHQTADYTTDHQTCTGTFTDTNCAQGSNAATCTKCKDGYKINGTACVQIFDNCNVFDSSTSQCTECDKDYFLSEDHHCCPAGYKKASDDANCVVIPSATQPNCVQLDPTTPAQCKVCEKGYYLVNAAVDFCCKNRNYCSAVNSASPGLVKNCEKYDTSGNDCTTCETDHSLMTLSGGVKYCYPTPFSGCVYSQFKANAGGVAVNSFECTQCPKNHNTNDLGSAVNQWIRHYLIEACWVTDTQAQFQESTLKCKYCDYDYYLVDGDKSCSARSSTYTDNCEIRDLFNDKCLRCDKGYHLTALGACGKQTDCLLETENTDGTATCAQCIDTKRFLPTGSMTTNDGNGITQVNSVASFTKPLAYGCELKTAIDTTLINAHKPEADPPGYFPGMIKKCERHYQCKEDYVNGLDINLHKYLSCHVCIEDDRIPFISLDLDKQGGNIEEKGIKRFSYKNTSTESLDRYNENKFGKSSQCFKSDLSEFQANNPTEFPDNCAIGILNSAVIMNVSISSAVNVSDSDNLGVFCAACKPGYKPMYSNIDYHIYQCQAITNCVMTGEKASKKSFNECDHCNDTFYHPYTTANGLDKTVCMQSGTQHDPNCYAFDTVNNQCKVCLDGYSKNYENKCEKLEIPYCENGMSNFKAHLEQRDYRLAFYRGVEGCKDCNKGFLPLYRDSLNDYTCIYSPYARSNVFNTTNPKYTSNCKRYYEESGLLVCDKCLQNFIITNLKQCVSINTNHSNCIVAKDTNSCYECNTETVLVKGKCLDKTIENCLTYQENQEELLCESCVDGFYLKDQICYGGEIQNCARYTSENVCTSCKDGYQLIKNKLNQYFCINVISDMNCNNWNEGQFTNMSIKCETCDPLYYLNTSLATTNEVCLPLYTIDGCQQYNVNSLYSNSTLMCDECQINMYLSEGKCLIRTARISGCIKYDLNKDACGECQEGFYLAEDQMSCILNPSGTVSCAIYDENEACILCKPSFYLMNEKCFALPAADTISNCQAYDSEKQCMKCEDGYILETNECKSKNINNCLVYESSTDCKVCENGFGIEIKEGVKVCTTIPIVSNCEEYQVDNAPFPCTRCQVDYYLNPNENQCVAVEGNKLIKNCVYYNNNQSCQACDGKYVLTADQTQCILLNHPSNCDAHVESSTPFCTKCEVGYVLNQSYECVEGPQKEFDNCLVTELDNRSVCALCQPGYYMKSDKNCYKSNIDNEEESSNENENENENNNGDNENGGDNNPNENDNEEDNNEGANVFGMLWLSIATFMMILF